MEAKFNSVVNATNGGDEAVDQLTKDMAHLTRVSNPTSPICPRY